eukprot:4990236-Pyramimonas_sp.AAC.1
MASSASSVEGLPWVWEKTSGESLLSVLRFAPHALRRPQNSGRHEQLPLGKEGVTLKETMEQGARRSLASGAERGVACKGSSNPNLCPKASRDHTPQRVPLAGREALAAQRLQDRLPGDGPCPG